MNKIHDMDATLKYEDYAFLGYEFLLNLWFKSETKDNFEIVIGDKIVFSKFDDKGAVVESITIKGEESDAIIGKVALTEGFSLTEIKVDYSRDNPIYNVTLKGKELALNGFKSPKIDKEDADDIPGAMLENIYHIKQIEKFIDSEYKNYILERESGVWVSTVEKIKLWIEEG